MPNGAPTVTPAEQAVADDKMRAEIAKIMAESAKIAGEARWYPLVVSAGLVASIAGATGLIMKALGVV